jgi:hypothetical protein
LETGMNLVMYDVYCLSMMLLFPGLKYQEYSSSITIMNNDDIDRT